MSVSFAAPAPAEEKPFGDRRDALSDATGSLKASPYRPRVGDTVRVCSGALAGECGPFAEVTSNGWVTVRGRWLFEVRTSEVFACAP